MLTTIGFGSFTFALGMVPVYPSLQPCKGQALRVLAALAALTRLALRASVVHAQRKSLSPCRGNRLVGGSVPSQSRSAYAAFKHAYLCRPNRLERVILLR